MTEEIYTEISYKNNFFNSSHDCVDKNSELLEMLLQKIHNLENERDILKFKLTSVESDYDAEIKELQTDIVGMRLDLKKERKMCRKIERERNAVIQELTQQNQVLTQRLKFSNENEAQLKEELVSWRSKFMQRKSSMQEHFHTLESLRLEISHLREEKNHLETKLQSVVEERDNLLESLNESHQEIKLLHQVNSEQSEKISSQDFEISKLQMTANALHNRLHKLSMQDQICAKSSSENNARIVEDNRPHLSLMAELAEQKMNILNQKDSGLLNPMIEDDDDTEFEMDDDAFLTYLAHFDEDNFPDNLLQSIVSQPIETRADSDNKETFINELRMEVTEIYQQMNQMCLELHALSGIRSMNENSESGTKHGTHTPDELAMVEMDFRLGSLRSVLTDLRGLLKDLNIDLPNNNEPTCKQFQNSNNNSIQNDTTTKNQAKDSQKSQFNHPHHLTDYEKECEVARSERDALALELLNAQQELLKLKQQIENGTEQINNNQVIEKNNGNSFVANWEEFEEEKYEYEMPG